MSRVPIDDCMRSVTIHNTVIPLSLTTWDQWRQSQRLVLGSELCCVADKNHDYEHLKGTVNVVCISMRVLSIIGEVDSMAIKAWPAVSHV